MGHQLLQERQGAQVPLDKFEGAYFAGCRAEVSKMAGYLTRMEENVKLAGPHITEERCLRNVSTPVCGSVG